MIWLVAVLDPVAALWLLRGALPRQRRDRDGVLAVGLLLLLCAVLLVGIGLWRVSAEPAAPALPPASGISV